MSQQQVIQKWTNEMIEIFQDLKSNTKYKQSCTKVTQTINLLSAQLQWTANPNSKPGLINLQSNKLGLKQLLTKLNITNDYDKQRLLIAKAYATKKSTNQSIQNALTTNLLNQDISQQVLLVHYANSIHVIRQSHQKNSFQLQKSHLITAPLLNLNKNTRIIIQPYSTYSNSPSNSTIDMTKMNYQFLLNKLKQSEQHYHQLMEFKTNLYHGDQQHINKLTLLHTQFQSLLNQLLTLWHHNGATFRLAIITQNDQSPQAPPNFFIYHPFQPFYSYKTSPLFNIALQSNQKLSQSYSPLPNIILHIRLIKELLLYQLLYFKHQPAINNFKLFQKRLQTQFYQLLKQKQQNAQHQKVRKIQKIKNTKSLSNYQNIQIKSFFLNWNKSIKSKSSTKTAYLSIDLNSMYLVTDYKYVRMKCELFISYIDKKNKQNESTIETKYFKFLFDKNNDDWSVKLIPEDDKSTKRNVIFDLSKVSDFFNLQVKITPQGKKGNIYGFCTISKRQKLNGFGDNEQLVLSQSVNTGNQRTVGFLKLFYLIQESYDMKKAQSFNLQRYRNIKVLQTMPRIPANYFEETLINYNPNEMRLYSQMVSSGSGGVSRVNFQRVYLQMIEFLEGERMDQRRENLIMIENEGVSRQGQQVKRKEKVFLPHQRMREYEKVMRVKLGKEIVNSYKGLESTHWIDSQYKIIRSEAMKQGQFSDGDLVEQFSLMVINDELSTKTSMLVNQQLKHTMYQSQTLLVSKPHAQTMGVMSTIFGLSEHSVDEYKGQVYRTNSGESNNRRVRVARCANRLASFSIQAFNPYIVPLINRLITLFKHHQVQETDYRSSTLQRQSISMSSNYHQPIDLSRLTTFIINFLNKVYPYYQPKCLQQQLMYIRYFVAKYLPQLSYQLNRKNIGLQNLVSKYLLSLFTTDLEEQVTFQIWDFIIHSNNKFSARINSILTLLIFMEKNNFSPLIPLDTFVIALKQNYNKFDLSYNAKKVSELMISSLGQFYEKEHKRKAELWKMRDSKGGLLMGDEFVKRVLFDTERQNRVSYQKNKVNLNDLNYKLPQPKYYGHPVEELQVLIKSLVLLETVSVQKWRLSVRWHNQCSSKSIVEKSQIMNSYIRFEYPKYLLQNLHEMPPLQFIISPNQQEQQGRYFIGCLQVMGLHKDSVYCQQVKMVYVRNGEIIQSNKGENVINVQIILKSHLNHNKTHNNNKRITIMNNNSALYNSRSSVMRTPQSNTQSNNTLNLQKQYYLLTKSTQQRIYSSLLDYDLSQQNCTALTSIIQLRKQLIKMKNPIDQFAKQKYERVKITHLGDNSFPQIVMNSQLLIQQLQSLIESFNDDKMRTILPALYKLYSQQTNYQMVFLTEILIEAILLDSSISFQTKIQYLYLVGKHYQNCNSKGLTSQTADFIFQYIYKTYGWLNPVPYTKQNKGAIIKAFIYTKGIKNTDNTLDITQILQDAAHINKIKYGQYSIVLGNSQYLTQFRQLLPLQTLQMLQQSNNNKEIKIQITYSKNKSQYLYTANVDLKDFKITQQGGKFLSKHPVRKELNANKRYVHNQNCGNINKLFYSTKTCHPQCISSTIDLDTSSEILYNCNNIISLQSPQTLDKIYFRKAIYTTPMISYLLNYSSLFEPIKHGIMKKSIIPRPPIITNEQIQLREYRDWVLYRYQHCQQEWRRCRVQKVDDDNIFLKFHPNQLKIQNYLKQLLSAKYNQKILSQIYCKAPSFQVWSMQENLVDYNDSQTQQTHNEQFRINQKKTMRKISSMYLSKN